MKKDNRKKDKAAATSSFQSKKNSATPTATIQWLPWLLALIAIAAYSNTLFHQFALDDRAVTFQNKFVMQGLTGIPKILTTFYWAGFWDSNAGLFRPLSLIMFAVEWQISPNNPPVHHFINVLIYALSIALLFKLICNLFEKWSVWFAFSVTLLFALHPIHTEVVANIKSRDELLCFLFFIVTALFLIRNKTYDLKNTLIASVAFFACLLSKEGGILYLPIFVLILLLLKQNTITDILKKTAPLAVVTIIWLAWHQYVVSSAAQAKITYTYWDNSLVACDSVGSRVATGLSILGRYLLKSFWPYQMSYDYSYAQVPCETIGSLNVLATLIACVALFAVAFMVYKKHPVITFGILFFFVTSVLFINVFTLIGATMADRFLFAPVLGTILCVMWLLYNYMNELQVQNWQHKSIYAAILIGLLFGYKTYSRNFEWKSDATIFTADVNASDKSARTHYNYATVLFSDLPEDEPKKFARLDSAITEFRKGISIDSNDYNAYTNLGVALYRRKFYAESIKATRHALTLKPDSDLLTNLGDAFYMNKDFDSSIYYHTVSIRTGRAQKDTYNLLGSAFFARNQFPIAVQVFRDGLAKDSTYGNLWLNYGNACGVLKDYQNAIDAFNKAYQYDSTLKTALYYISITYSNMGDKAKADEYLQRYNSVK